MKPYFAGGWRIGGLPLDSNISHEIIFQKIMLSKSVFWVGMRGWLTTLWQRFYCCNCHKRPTTTGTSLAPPKKISHGSAALVMALHVHDRHLTYRYATWNQTVRPLKIGQYKKEDSSSESINLPGAMLVSGRVRSDKIISDAQKKLLLVLKSLKSYINHLRMPQQKKNNLIKRCDVAWFQMPFMPSVCCSEGWLCQSTFYPLGCKKGPLLGIPVITSRFISGHLGVSKNSGTPKWMVYNGKPY